MDSNAAQFSREDDKACQDVTVPPAAEEPSRPQGFGPQAAGEAGPGCQSTTQDPSSHPLTMEGSPNCLISGGIDWFEWTGLIDFSTSANFESIATEFLAVKEYCQNARCAYQEVHLPDFGPVRVSRLGLNRGGERGQHFEFSLRIAGVKIGLSPRSGEALSIGKKRQQANFYALQSGRDCLLFGALQGYQRTLELVKYLGGELAELKLSRADLCLDICNLAAQTLLELVKKGHFITLAREVRPYINYVTNDVTGFSAGIAPIRLSVYDKIMERMGKSDALYLQALVDRRWYGGHGLQSATRIEYQMHRRWLVEQGISTPDDFLRLRGSLCEKLTHEWFRLTEKHVDRRNKHQSRAAIHPIWKGIQQSFATIFGLPDGPLVRIRREKVMPMKLSKQGRGCLAKALLQMGMQFETYNEFAEMAKHLLLSIPASKAQAMDFMAQLERLRMEFEAT
jgi:hypothetical protein